MPSTTSIPTTEELQAKITKLERRNATLLEKNEALNYELAGVLEREQEAQEQDERRTERARQVIVEYHDDQQHPGPQTFCTQAPCGVLNDLLARGEL